MWGLFVGVEEGVKIYNKKQVYIPEKLDWLVVVCAWSLNCGII